MKVIGSKADLWRAPGVSSRLSRRRACRQTAAYNKRVQFEWNSKKASTNARKHRVTFEEDATVFGDAFAITFDDPDHSVGERRLLAFGISDQGRLLVVSYQERRGIIRLVSARRAIRAERHIYEEG